MYALEKLKRKRAKVGTAVTKLITKYNYLLLFAVDNTVCHALMKSLEFFFLSVLKDWI